SSDLHRVLGRAVLAGDGVPLLGVPDVEHRVPVGLGHPTAAGLIHGDEVVPARHQTPVRLTTVMVPAPVDVGVVGEGANAVRVGDLPLVDERHRVTSSTTRACSPCPSSGTSSSPLQAPSTAISSSE